MSEIIVRDNYPSGPKEPQRLPMMRHGVTLEGPKDGMLSCCINCSFFNEPMEQCNKFKARPPARVIAFGCKDYLDIDEIPF